MLDTPASKVTAVRTAGGQPFKVVRDDLSHPYIGGNKRRKLDGLWPQLVQDGFQDVVTCGGTQSAHVLAVAAAAAEHGMRAHLLVRGEPPAVVTGNHLFAKLLAHRLVYVTRRDYADRMQMLASYALQLEQELGPDTARIAVIPEGGAEAASLLGNLRMMDWLARDVLDPKRPSTLFIDSGTGTSAVGMALGAALLQLPWTVVGVMLAGPLEYYTQQASSLVAAFCAEHSITDDASWVAGEVGSRLAWAERPRPRKLGRVLPGEIERCSALAAAHGIVLDPMWTLSAWEAAEAAAATAGSERDVVMVHTGGGLGLCGLAQRFPDEF